MHNLFCSSGITSHIITCICSGFTQEQFIRQETIQQSFQFIIIFNGISALCFEQLNGFHKFLILRSENHRNAINCSLKSIVDSHSETTSDIGNLAIAVDGREQPEAVDNQAVGLTDILLVGTGIAHVGAFQFTDNLYQMVFVDNVRSDNQLHLWMLVKVFNKQILVRLPGASCHESHRVVLEKLHQRQMFGLLTNLQHTVKTGIPLIVDMLSGEILAKASSGNGQIRYGADVINRIIESQKPGGHERLQNAIIKETLNPMISNMCRAAKISSQQIYRAAIAGNTTMEHLMMGINADPLRMEPYIPAFFKTNSLFASDVNLAIHPDAHIILAPNIGSYVGGDITAGALVSMIWNRPEMSLFIDLGTNGELAFGNSDFMVSCACSAGPAFEGGDISCGMRATDGAIEKCTIDPETMEPSYHVIGDEGTKPIGLCGSGIIDVIAALFRAKMVNPKGKFIREGRRICHDKYGMGSYVIAFEEEAGSVRDVEITEVDIDNFIRAKGAIFSAIRTMLNYLDMCHL